MSRWIFIVERMFFVRPIHSASGARPFLLQMDQVVWKPTRPPVGALGSDQWHRLEIGQGMECLEFILNLPRFANDQDHDKGFFEDSV